MRAVQVAQEEMATMEGEERARQEKHVQELLAAANEQQGCLDPDHAFSASPRYEYEDPQRVPCSENDAHTRLDRLAQSALLEEEGLMGPTCFGPRIHGELFPIGFTLPRDTPKYNGTAKPEDWLIDYTTAVGIARGTSA
ncbi:hypothetical protein ZWY2020_053278 [Hordeum vulgare]|nr:hypothetical protein ZWY2020_053278 [Hordeum vulgare]